MDDISRRLFDSPPTVPRIRTATARRPGTVTRRLPRTSRTPTVESVATLLGGLLGVLALAALVWFTWPVMSAYLAVMAVVVLVFAPIAVPILLVRVLTAVLDYAEGR